MFFLIRSVCIQCAIGHKKANNANLLDKMFKLSLDAIHSNWNTGGMLPASIMFVALSIVFIALNIELAYSRPYSPYYGHGMPANQFGNSFINLRRPGMGYGTWHGRSGFLPEYFGRRIYPGLISKFWIIIFYVIMYNIRSNICTCRIWRGRPTDFYAEQFWPFIWIWKSRNER